jgi:hypothetical protein
MRDRMVKDERALSMPHRYEMQPPLNNLSWTKFYRKMFRITFEPRIP